MNFVQGEKIQIYHSVYTASFRVALTTVILLYVADGHISLTHNQRLSLN